jgi:hypothetical protein
MSINQYTSLNDAAFIQPVLAPGDLQIWYRRDTLPTQGFIYPAIDPNNLEETHILLGEIQGADNLEMIFCPLQGESWSPNGEAHDLITSLGLHHTSMSIGDVIRKSNGTVYVVGMCGFDVITP